jgi:outer membrane biogenesis lipoprotein LolB
MVRCHFVALSAVAILAACKQAPPAPTEKQMGQEQAEKARKKDDIHINHTGW